MLDGMEVRIHKDGNLELNLEKIEFCTCYDRFWVLAKGQGRDLHRVVPWGAALCLRSMCDLSNEYRRVI